MHCTYEISPQIYWVGGNDRRLERFENMFPLPNGVSYNSYLILDEKTALIDTVDASISALYHENIAHVLNGRDLDYLVINHMEPDHCANIEEILRRYPNVKVIGNQKTFSIFCSILYSRYVKELFRGKRWGRDFHRKAYPTLLLYPYGTLARSYVHL